MAAFDLGSIQDWMDRLSTWQLAVVCSGVLVGVTWAGIIFIKPFIRLWLRRQANSNDLVGFTSSGFSLVFGLLLGLLSVATYQNAADVAKSVDLEAAAVASLYQGLTAYPEPLRGELQFLVRDYTQYVIHKDWPAHREGKIWNGGAARLQVIQQKILSLDASDPAKAVVQSQTLSAFNALVSAREQRLTGVRTAIPGVLWYVVAIGVVINIMLIWLLDMRFTTHMILGGVMSFFLGVVLFLLVGMDRPMRGSVSVTPQAFQVVYDHVMRWDEAP